MYITKEQSIELVNDFLEDMKNGYSEKLTFLSKLIEGDDWSLVIKSHALFESLITELIVLRNAENNLKKVIERMPLHGETVSKIAILKTYELLKPNEISFIVKLSEIRNRIVHKYENLNFTFEKFIADMNSEQTKNWKKLLRLESIETNKMDKLILEMPVYAIWFNILNVINSILYQTYQLKANHRLTEESQKTSNELLELFMNNA
jgi:hypothetical protein